MRLISTVLACLLLTGCLSPMTQLNRAMRDPIDYSNQAVVATTMEVRIEDSPLVRQYLGEISRKAATNTIYVSEYDPDSNQITRAVQNVSYGWNPLTGMQVIVTYAKNAHHQEMRVESRNPVELDWKAVDSGWYVVESYTSTAGFDIDRPGERTRTCMGSGFAPRPGVRPVELKVGEIGYFGHAVFTVAMRPAKYATMPFDLALVDSRIEPAPANLDALLREQGLDPARVRRFPPENFPCH